MVLNNLVIYLGDSNFIKSHGENKFFDVFRYLFSIPILYDHIITSSSVFSRVPSNPASAAGDRLRLRPRAPGCCGCPADSGGGNAGNCILTQKSLDPAGDVVGQYMSICPMIRYYDSW